MAMDKIILVFIGCLVVNVLIHFIIDDSIIYKVSAMISSVNSNPKHD